MKRDMDLFRDILIKLEEHPKRYFHGRFYIDDVDNDLVQYHLTLMQDANLVTGSPRPADSIVLWSNLRMTNEGHNFLDDARNETVWKDTKSFVMEKGGSVSLDILKDLLKVSARKYFLGE